MTDLPPGFVLDSTPSVGGSLPAGFVLDGQSDNPVQDDLASYVGNVLSGNPDRASQAVAREQGRQAGLNAGIGRTVGAGLQKGALANFSDEAAGLADASGLPVGAPPILAAPIGAARLGLDALGLTSGDASKRYDQGREKARGFYEGMTEKNPVSSIGSQVVGSMALPAGTAKTAAQGAKVGAGYGALAGFGEGEGEGRLGSATVGGGLGAALGAGAGALSGRLARGAETAPSTNPADVVEAAERLGVQLPKAAASDSMSTQWAGRIASNIPFAGNPLRKASEKAITQIGDAAKDAAQSIGATSPYQAGATARDAIEGYAGRGGLLSKGVSAAYDKVDEAIDGSVRTPLRATQSKVADILARRQEQRISDPGKASSFVKDAIQDADGLTYDGIKGLRTRIGEMLDNPGLMPEGTSQAELRQIYGALSDDLQSAVKAAGGDRALTVFRRANAFNRVASERRKNLERLVGAKNDEGVLERILATASTKGRADTKLLWQARKAVGKEGWDEISGTLLDRLGRDAEGNFSPARFLTDYSKISEPGKAVLFSSTGRGDISKAIDDIAKVSSRFKSLNQFANPSGTGQQVTGAGIGAGAIMDPFSTGAMLLGGNVLSRVLARPATAKSMARWARAYANAAEGANKSGMKGLATLEAMSRQFSATLAKELGVTINPLALTRLAGGQPPATADEEMPGNRGFGPR